MIVLHLSVHNTPGEGMKIQCDRLRREDVTDAEAAIANLLHDGLALILQAMPGTGPITIIEEKNKP